MQPIKYYKQIPVGEELPEKDGSYYVNYGYPYYVKTTNKWYRNYLLFLEDSRVCHVAPVWWLKEVDIKQIVIGFVSWLHEKDRYNTGLSSSKLWDIYIEENKIKRG